MTKLLVDTINSQIGHILIVTDSEHLCMLDFAACEARIMNLLQKRYQRFDLIAITNPQGFSQQVQAYLAGDLQSIDNIPANPGGTPFQQQVWSALRTIPPGTTISYRELATRIGKPAAYRAVGMANSQNPVAIVLPCHRVVGTNGSLTGYAGGIERKRWLLQHEGVDCSKLK
ncbi:MAG: methylated-DNA--[protein]-cysteine S-methyltransferase [Leptolyngbyaceae cyanobacterium HOT.MB2.61]|jgi:methylated-DNA-[protein]-cysteine S-methyltransferase|nr:methylated-DNA--[protein]-cysteine S-methyltransferase [Leptolyngbyaceae cyanobacterium HOT.MB2.61]